MMIGLFRQIVEAAIFFSEEAGSFVFIPESALVAEQEREKMGVYSTPRDL